MRQAAGPRKNLRATNLKLVIVGIALFIVAAGASALQESYGGWILFGAFAAGGAGAFYASRLNDGPDQQTSVLIILVAATAMRLAMLFVAPNLSTDIYRYVWDGRVQANGVNPYRYTPNAPELARLRDATIYPNINRADRAVTIYPPLAQAIFFSVTRLGETVTVMKLGLLAFEGVTVALTLALLARLGIAGTRIAAYAWHPLPVWEIASNGHVDAAMCTLLLAGLLLFVQGRTLLAGVAATLGAAIKPTALLALPVFWRPWNWRLPLVVMLTAVLVYLPYLSVGRGVIGYLPGYLDEEGLTSGNGVNFIWLLQRWTGPLPHAIVPYVAVSALLLAGLALAISFRSDRSALTSISCLNWLIVTFLILASPHYPWYLLVLVPFLTIAPTATGWALTLGSPLIYEGIAGAGLPDYDTRIAAYMLATLAGLACDFWQARRRHILIPVGEST